MKLAIKILKAVLVLVLTAVIIGIVTIKVASSTILDEAYAHKMLQTSKYYDNLHEEIKSAFENYIGPSGIDEIILDDVCSVEDIQKDTETILGNIYEGTDKKVNTDEIKKRIIDKINQKVKEQEEIITDKMQASINKFAETVADEYISTISHTEYEEKINEAYKKITKIVEFSQKALFIAVAVIFILLVALNIKKIYYIASNIGIALLSSGTFITATYYIINSKVKVSQFKILNNSISLVLQNIVTDILNMFVNIGWILLAIGIVAIIVGNIIKIINTEEGKKKERKWKN
ncbi:MAG: hypothetical protein IKF83_01030 [Clostridia bacterium]|nr:hypothetical protein [Clostridia bacterium]